MHRSLSAAWLVTPLVFTSPALAQEAEFLARFAGSWSGSGTAKRNADEDANRVRCTIQGSASSNALSLRGTCRAAVIFSRNFGADVEFDPGSGRYRGTYTGSKIGPAGLSGARRGDAVHLTITWPRPVNGDTTAQMSIRNSGDGRLHILVTDEVEPGGPVTETTNLALGRN
jgi:hypothetical protein